ncbi:undecaprenyl-diphosphate phosphatase [Crassaminicella thermophila]|uniref:Undecaprenyl-diphosphatase n=1 Tax=Crassaminicella thermophila TaxID=2599308 RepID=A0A5C0SJ88_CRATE|nr:undecaprenyl-diphosphate phosphatase [Crassaminicella thermophila]QEK13514.1 undecaprenyl-diphosphate phosphatase [Crassaminicella thermophila]
MSDILKAVILSIVEGITEFLPISSTGHLILVNHWIEFKGSFANAFDVIIQFGAILSVLFLYWNQLNPFSKSKNRHQKRESIILWFKVIVAFIPAVILGLLVGDFIEEKLFNPITVAIALSIGGIIIILLEKREKTPKFKSISQISYKVAFLIGLFQCLAMIPGTSRSAATIIGAMFLGASRQVAAEFSFFLAIPTMAGATAYSLMKKGLSITSSQWIVLLVGVILSFIVALTVIAFFMKYIKRRDFKVFGYYRILLGGLILIYFNLL